MNVKILITLFLFVLSTYTLAQNVLLLEKTGTNKRTTFRSGDLIRYKLADEDHYRNDYIVSIKDSSLVFHYHKINIEEISEIDIRKKNFIDIDLEKVGSAMQIAGAGYVVLDNFNRYVVQGENYEFDNDVWITGGALIAIGTGVKFLKPRKFKVGGKYKLRIIDINYL